MTGNWQDLHEMAAALRDPADVSGTARPSAMTLALILKALEHRIGRLEQLAEALAADLGGERCKIVLARREQPMPKAGARPADPGRQP